MSPPDLETELGQFLEPWVERIGVDKVIDALDFYVATFENRREIEAVDLKRTRALFSSAPAPQSTSRLGLGKGR